MSNPLVIIDHMSLIHPFVHSRFQGENDAINWVNFFRTPANYLPDNPLASPFDFQTVLVSDQKTSESVLGIGESVTNNKYWRHQYHQAYKSGRKPTNNLLSLAKQLTARYWVESGGQLLAQPGFEADDFAAYICSEYPTVPKFLMTVDSDWAGLVRDESEGQAAVMWLDTYAGKYVNKSRLNMLDSQRVLDRFNNHRDFQGQYFLEQPSDIYPAKWMLGDKSDNIPAHQSVPFGIIDLINPMRKVDPVEVKGSVGKLTSEFRCDMFGVPNFEWI